MSSSAARRSLPVRVRKPKNVNRSVSSPATTSADQWLAYQLHRPDLNAGLVVAFRRSASHYPALMVKLNGIRPDIQYVVETIDQTRNRTRQTMTGQALAGEQKLSIDTKPGSVLLRYAPADQTTAAKP